MSVRSTNSNIKELNIYEKVVKQLSIRHHGFMVSRLLLDIFTEDENSFKTFLLYHEESHFDFVQGNSDVHFNDAVKATLERLVAAKVEDKPILNRIQPVLFYLWFGLTYFKDVNSLKWCNGWASANIA